MYIRNVVLNNLLLHHVKHKVGITSSPDFPIYIFLSHSTYIKIMQYNN